MCTRPRFASASAVYLQDESGRLTPLVATRPKDAPPSEDEMTAATNVATSGQAEMTPELIVVPLTNNGHALGVMAFVSSGGDRSYRDEDLVFARDLAHHAALVLVRGVTVV